MHHFAYLHVFFFCFFAYGSTKANVNLMIYSKLENRIINQEYREKKFTAKSRIECIRSSCIHRINNCAVSYNSHNFRCMSAPVNGWIISYNKDKFTNIDNSWTTYITKVSTQVVVRPAVLYLLDNINKGYNFGDKGDHVNLIETGLDEWSESGPRGVHSHLLYLISGASNRAQIPYKTSSGSYLIDFTKPFTVAAWVKTDTSVVGIIPIIEGRSMHSIPDFWFASSKNQDQLNIGPKYPDHYYESQKNATGKQFWRHVAAVYRGYRDAQFYLNGSSFGQTKIFGNENLLALPDRLMLGNADHIKQFPGAMACVTIHEKALSQAEVAALMSLCP